MRNAFNIELQIDIKSSDGDRLNVFVDLITETARMLYGQAAMIATKPPTLKVSHIGVEGKTNLNVFEGEAFKADED